MNSYRKRWVEALRSGKYEQGRRRLHNLEQNTYCCLGVACDLFADELGVRRIDAVASEVFDGESGFLPKRIAEALDITGSGTLSEWVEGYRTLTQLNDGAGYTFDQIANLIEADKLEKHHVSQ